MHQHEIDIDQLLVNRANDRHGELGSEPAAIAELFRRREQHMKRLAQDITSEGRIYELPLVSPEGEGFIVFDGNRRVTCLKLLLDPTRAPSQVLQEFFQDLRLEWQGGPLTRINCTVEEDREVIDSILFRRHTGAQGGVGQSQWDDRAKRNFGDRTGRNERIDVAEQVELILNQEDMAPNSQIPRSTLNRLLSSEATRSRMGVSALGNEFRITHDRDTVVNALARVASDLAERHVVLGDLWDNEGKRAYLDRLEGEGLLPRADQFLAEQQQEVTLQGRRPARRRRPSSPRAQSTFIPSDVPAIQWTGDQHRLRFIWEELQALNVQTFPNAVSALVRMLLELSTESYITHHELRDGDNLAQKVRISADHLLTRGVLEQEYRAELERMRQGDELISIRSMQRYVHSEHFAPMPNELITYWGRLGPFILGCVNR